MNFTPPSELNQRLKKWLALAGHRKTWWVIGILLIVLAGYGIIKKHPAPEKASQTEQIAIHLLASELQHTKHEEMTHKYRFTGYLLPKDTIQINAEVSGVVQKITTQIGDRVNQNQLLMRLDPTVYQQKKQHAEADVTRAKAVWLQSKQQLQRSSLLLAKGAISTQDMEDKQSLYDQHTAELAAATADLKQAELDYHHTIIYSPSQAIIQAQPLSVGSIVALNDPLFTLAVTDQLWLTGSLSSEDAIHIHPHDAVSFAIAGQTETYHTVIDHFAANLTEETQSLTFYASVDNTAQHFPIGLFVQGKIISPDKLNGWIVPTGALHQQRHQHGDFLWIARSHQVVEIPVKVLTTDIEADQILLTGDIHDGDDIILTPGSNWHNHQPLVID